MVREVQVDRNNQADQETKTTTEDTGGEKADGETEDDLSMLPVCYYL